MRFVASSLVVFTLGFFALSAQTLLFRDFLTVFEGNELGIACFFCSWLIWICVGAFFSREENPCTLLLARHIHLIALFYIPAFILQKELILHSRSLIGVKSYTLFPLGKMVAASFLTNSMTSLLTGFLFPLACLCRSNVQALPVAQVYILETAGSLTGALGVTLFLVFGFSSEWVACFSFLVVAIGTASYGVFTRVRRGFSVIPLLVLLCLFGLRFDRSWTIRNDLAAWSRLLPEKGFRGGFSTPQTRYLYGEYGGEFQVVSWGGVTENLPGTERASEVIALALCQNPTAKNILVLSEGGLALCNRLTELPSVRKITWVHPDPDYAEKVWGCLPQEFRNARDRVETIPVDVREWLATTNTLYDVVILDLPDPRTLVLNRYFTLEFQVQVKKVLTRNGILCLRFSGGSNYLGEELSFLGASLFSTLREVYKNVVLKPGEDSWWIASDGDNLTETAAELRTRFASIPGAPKIYPPEGLLSLYLQDRIEFQRSKYKEVLETLNAQQLINRDSSPKALFYSLLVGLHQSGFSVVSPLFLFSQAGLGILLAAVILYGVLRLVYLRRGLVHAKETTRPLPLFDSGVLVFLAGFLGIALNIYLLFAYQSLFGSLFLEIGLVTALFMAGLFIFAAAIRGILRKVERESLGLLPSVLLCHLLCVISTVSLSENLGKTGFYLLFIVAGGFTGIYFPIVAHRFQVSGKTTGSTGSTLEVLDHFGGAAGSFFTGLLFIPVLGSQSLLPLSGALISVNLVPSIAVFRRSNRFQDLPVWEHRARAAGYVLFGIGTFALIASLLLSHFGSLDEENLLEQAARAMISQNTQSLDQHRFPGTENAYYVSPASGEEPTRYLFSSKQLGENHIGFGGPIDLAIKLREDGTLEDFRILRSNETPAYVRYLMPWFEKLKGRHLFSSDAFEGIDAVTGATLTSRAVLETLKGSANSFGNRVLRRNSVQVAVDQTPMKPDPEFAVLCFFLAGAFFLRWWPGRWRRRLFLLGIVAVCGWMWNLQYSSQQIFSLLSLNLLPPSPTGTFLLLLVIPVLTLLVGNLYCGYLCPFGALQELIGELRPGSLHTDPGKPVWRVARFMKYILLFLLVLTFSLTRDSRSLVMDPLITFFGKIWNPGTALIATGSLILSFFFRRFWCRNLCPVGAFLSLLGGAFFFKKFFPQTYPSHCDLGIKKLRELDCLTCDRCRLDVRKESDESGFLSP